MSQRSNPNEILMGQKANLGASPLGPLMRHLSPLPESIHSLGWISITMNSKDDSPVNCSGFCLFPRESLCRQDWGWELLARRALLSWPCLPAPFPAGFPLRTRQTRVCFELWSASSFNSTCSVPEYSQGSITPKCHALRVPMILGLARYAYQADTGVLPLFCKQDMLWSISKNKSMIKNSFCLAKVQFQSHFLALGWHWSRVIVWPVA